MYLFHQWALIANATLMMALKTDRARGVRGRRTALVAGGWL